MKIQTPVIAAVLLLARPASTEVRESQFAPRFEPDCADVVFQPEDPPLSKPVTLTSREWLTTCAPDGRGEGCWESPGRSDVLTVAVDLVGRGPLLPWESDVFRVCLTGSLLRTEAVSTAYEYRAANEDASDGAVVMVCGPKRALPPDPRGVQAALTPELNLVFRDQWAAYYLGTSILLKIALKKEGDFWPDETVAEQEVALPAAEGYSLNFGGGAREPGIYYARYSIRRLGGRVSTEDETPVLRTQKVSYDADGALRASTSER
ncbi:MAG: hypothetical protein ACHQ49_18185 [Elusimicrobiota bacterium]